MGGQKRYYKWDNEQKLSKNLGKSIRINATTIWYQIFIKKIFRGIAIAYSKVRNNDVSNACCPSLRPPPVNIFERKKNIFF